jgi:putative DNA methylase
MTQRAFIEVQFPIGPLSLESYKERKANHAQILKTLGKWWGEKPMVLTRAIIIASVFPAASDPDRWPDDLDIFMKLMCLDNAGMWKRKIDPLPAALCYPQATFEEREALFEEDGDRWHRGALTDSRQGLEKRVFFTLGHTAQREYCCRVEEIDGPPEESWAEINAYLGTSASTLPDLVQQLAQRQFGGCLKVGDAFSGMGSIPFEAAALGCDVYASDLNPVACLLTWGALNVIGGTNEFRSRVHAAQRKIYDQVDRLVIKSQFESSDEGWRAECYLYCLEITVPEWDGWRVPLVPTWLVAPKTKTWVQLVPIEKEKRFGFKVRTGGAGYAEAKLGTKQKQEVVCPDELWDILKRKRLHHNASRRIEYQDLLKSGAGIRTWSKLDVRPRDGDFLQERLYCIKWTSLDGSSIYREPRQFDLDTEERIHDEVERQLPKWQEKGWIPAWRIEAGKETSRLTRDRGWSYWHHLFLPRQLLVNGMLSERVGGLDDPELRAAATLGLGRVLNQNARLCGWSPRVDVEKTDRVFYNQALNPHVLFGARGLSDLSKQFVPQYPGVPLEAPKSITVCDAREVEVPRHIWITDPPYADAVNYDEISEFYLAWYAPHIRAAFPTWYTDSMRLKAVKGEDAPFRVAMAECYKRLAEQMPDHGIQVLMFTHKSTDVWEDLALIMWAAGLQVRQVWSIATETANAGVKQGNYVQATYNMVLRKRTSAKTGFVDFITPQVNKRVREVITRMRESQIQGDLARCGYTDTDYLLAAQATAAEVVTGFANIDGVDLDAELRTPNAVRGRSALRTLMENAKRTATDFLVPPAMDRAIRRASAGDPYAFWRQFSPEEKFLLKGLEGEEQGVFKIGAFQDLGRAYGLTNYEELMGPTRANDSRTKLPGELPRPEALRFEEVPASDRGLWAHSPTRHIYHALKLLAGGAEIDRAVKHLIDTTDFWNTRSTRMAPIIAYLKQTTASLPHWSKYQDDLAALAIGVENARG